MIFKNALWKLELMSQRVDCFFVGHSTTFPDQWCNEDEYCSKCFVTCPQDKVTLPRLLNRLYSWVVERKWRWFERLDGWLCENHKEQLPTWWEY